MSRHRLKCDPPFYLALKEGWKTAEIRFNDRDYQKGDILEIVAFDRNAGCVLTQKPYGEILYFDVTHVLADSKFLQPGYVMLSIKIRVN